MHNISAILLPKPFVHSILSVNTHASGRQPEQNVMYIYLYTEREGESQKQKPTLMPLVHFLKMALSGCISTPTEAATPTYLK